MYNAIDVINFGSAIALGVWHRAIIRALGLDPTRLRDLSAFLAVLTLAPVLSQFRVADPGHTACTFLEGAAASGVITFVSNRRGFRSVRHNVLGGHHWFWGKLVVGVLLLAAVAVYGVADAIPFVVGVCFGAVTVTLAQTLIYEKRHGPLYVAPRGGTHSL
jgi:hypothetical protein